MTKRIRLTQGKYAIVDDEDYAMLSKFKWCARIRDDGLSWYACRKVRIDGVPHQQQMHRLILNAPDGMMCDHRDGNGLNNRRSNLRLATPHQNGMNQRKSRANSSGYKGVSLHFGKYCARIKVNGRLIHLGAFDDVLDAATAYNVASIKYFGDFASINNIPKFKRRRVQQV